MRTLSFLFLATFGVAQRLTQRVPRTMCRLPAVVLGLTAVCSCSTTGSGPAVNGDGIDEPAEFLAADVNHDGSLVPNEVALYHHRKMLKIHDRDNDSFVSEAEWALAKPTSAKENKRQFQAIDANRDRRLSEGEAVAWIASRISFAKTFKKHDVDGDSNLRWKEVSANSPTELRFTVFSKTFG